jgi:glycosyltransferase involved in cell wall biosynthesis
MHLLVISNNPRRASFRQRISVYLDALRANGIDCEVAKLPAGSLARLKLFKHASDFAGVFLHKKGLNLFDAFWLCKYSKKIIYDFDDAVMYSPKAPERDSASHFRPWRRSVNLADVVIAGNNYLAELARKFNSNVKILPTGLDTNAYKVETNQKKDDKVRLVWIGSKSTLRYLAEIKPALEEVGSRFDSVVLRVVCDEFFDLRNMVMEKCTWSGETQVRDLITSDIGLAPLPDNRFVRGKCGFKALQYAAAGLPTVASPVGVNAEYVKDDATGFLAVNTQQWVDRIIQLVENPQLRERMGQEGRNRVQEFDVKVLGEQLVDLIKSGIKDTKN